MPRFGSVEYEKKDNIALMTLDEESKLNALSPGIREGLVAGFKKADRDDGIAVIVVTGKGKGFCAGGDISGMSVTVESGRNFAYDILAELHLPEKIRKPVIAAVQGLALGGGLELAIACDLIIASDKAKFGTPETKVGLVPGFAILRLHQIIGRNKAKELIYGGEMITAEEAHNFGFVNRVVPHDKLMDEAMSWAKQLAERPSLPMQLCKSAINKDLGGVELAYGIDSIAQLFGSDDTKEGIKAFMEKRKPVFSGK